MKQSLVGLTVVLVGCAGAEPVESAADVVRAMHDRYADVWYETMTFVQDAIFYEEDGSVWQEQEWWEAGRLPGNLRIDVAPFEDGRATVYANDTVYMFRDGELAATSPGFNALLLLGFDVYAQPAERTLEQLETLGYDLTKFHEDEWQGRAVYVVGADERDDHSRQFWVDQERLLFVRLLQPVGEDGTSIQEIQFNEYEPLGGGWIAPEVVFLRDGRVTWREVYRDMRANVELGDELFATDRYRPPAWVH
jgi:hypothetical protein